jgi:hypothetical protein
MEKPNDLTGNRNSGLQACTARHLAPTLAAFTTHIVLREVPHLVTVGSKPNCCSAPLPRLGNTSGGGVLLVEASLLTLLTLFPDPTTTTCDSDTQRRIDVASCSCNTSRPWTIVYSLTTDHPVLTVARHYFLLLLNTSTLYSLVLPKNIMTFNINYCLCYIVCPSTEFCHAKTPVCCISLLKSEVRVLQGFPAKLIITAFRGIHVLLPLLLVLQLM